MQRNFLIGSLNLVIAVIMTTIFAILLSFHIDNYQKTISLYFSAEFFKFDPFATELLSLFLASMLINYIAAASLFSGMFTDRRMNDIILFSLASILWIVMYITGAYNGDLQVLMVVPILLLLFMLIVFRRIQNLVIVGMIVVTTFLVGLLAFL